MAYRKWAGLIGQRDSFDTKPVRQPKLFTLSEVRKPHGTGANNRAGAAMGSISIVIARVDSEKHSDDIVCLVRFLGWVAEDPSNESAKGCGMDRRAFEDVVIRGPTPKEIMFLALSDSNKIGTVNCKLAAQDGRLWSDNGVVGTGRITTIEIVWQRHVQ